MDAESPISEEEKPFSLRKYTNAKLTIEMENCEINEATESLFLTELDDIQKY